MTTGNGQPDSTLTPVDWLRRALDVAVRAEAHDVVCGGGQRWAAQPISRAQEPENRYPIGLHHHSYPEVCLPLGGRGRLEVDGKCYALAPPRVSVLHAEVVHSEGFERADRPYTVMWMMPYMSSWKLWLIEYQGDRKWNGLAGWILQSRHGKALLDLLSAQRRMTPATLDSIRPGLVMVLAEALDMQTSHPTTQRTFAADVNEHHRQIVDQIRQLLDNNLNRAIRVDELGEFLHLSPDYVNRLFTRSVGQTIHRYHLERRMESAMNMLKEGKLMVKQIAYQVGFGDPLYFSRAFKKFHGVWPTQIAEV
jgi:AraC-like DNA-binding protein